MEKIKIQCPRCTKIYQINSDNLNLGLNKYNCTMCLGSFRFDYSGNNLQKIRTYLISDPNQGPSDWRNISISSSPKVSKPGMVGIRPFVIRKWKSLLEDFENENRHLDFIETCKKLDCLHFAVFKYGELNTEAGGDPICQNKLAELNFIQKNLENNLSKDLPVSYSWLDKKYYTRQRLFWISPFVLSMILILTGFMSLSFRNLVGVGVAIGVFSIGLMLMLKGKITFN